MARVFASPFRRALFERVRGEPWQLHEEGLAADLPAALPHWDYSTSLSLSRWLEIDLAGVRADCGFVPADRLRLVVSWRASATALHESAAAVELPAGEQQWQGRVEFSLAGRSLGGDVQISTHLVLAGSVEPVRPLTAHLPGSVLWEDSRTVAVEGRASRFPVEIIDFGSTSWAPEGSGWYLSWDPGDLHRPFLGSTRLYINAQHPKVAAAVQAPAAAPENLAVVSAVYFDVGRSLIAGVLNSDEFLEDPDAFGDGTTGKAVRRMMNAVFPNDSPAALRSMMNERPAYFQAVLQQQLHLFRG